MPSKTRRNLLALLGGGVAVGLTGSAVVYVQPETTPLVIVNNQMNSDLLVTTTIRTGEDETIVDDIQTIPAGDEQGYTELVADEPLVITVRTDNGLEETFQWTETAEENGLGVGITTEGVGFEVATS